MPGLTPQLHAAHVEPLAVDILRGLQGAGLLESIQGTLKLLQVIAGQAAAGGQADGRVKGCMKRVGGMSCPQGGAARDAEGAWQCMAKAGWGLPWQQQRGKSPPAFHGRSREARTHPASCDNAADANHPAAALHPSKKRRDPPLLAVCCRQAPVQLHCSAGIRGRLHVVAQLVVHCSTACQSLRCGLGIHGLQRQRTRSFCWQRTGWSRQQAAGEAAGGGLPLARSATSRPVHTMPADLVSSSRLTAEARAASVPNSGTCWLGLPDLGVQIQGALILP